PAAHPALHSFPTRRSSDLGESGNELGDRKDEPASLVLRFRGAFGRLIGKGDREVGKQPAERRPLAKLSRQCLGGTTGDVVLEQIDRKSTRLNSSHVEISYA